MSGLVAAQWPTPKTPMEAYDFVQAQRQAAGKLWAAKEPMYWFSVKWRAGAPR